MFRLDEAFKESWELFLKEQEEQSYKTMLEDIEEERVASEKAFDIIHEYLNLCALNETPGAPVGGGQSGEKQPGEDDKKKQPGEDDKKKQQTRTENDGMTTINKLLDLLKDNADKNARENDKLSYQPVKGIEITQDFFSFKFPQNIIFIIGRIVDWIKRVVIHFIKKFENIIRILIGEKTKELSDSDKDLQLRFTRSKELEKVVALPTIKSDGTSQGKFIKAYQASPDDVVKFRNIFTEAVGLERNIPDRQIVLSVDMSKELISLEQLIQHFFDIFDNALGSNGEHLFGTDDLEVMLDIFKDTYEDIKNYRMSSYEVSGTAVEVTPIDDRVMKDQLNRTMLNVNNLKEAYENTANAISRISTILSQKQMILASNMGVEFAFYSSATYARMIRIIKLIKPRIKDCEKLSKKLEKMQEAYGRISSELQNYSKKIGTISSMSYTTPYQKKITNMYNSSRYVTQIITLRLTALAAYIKELKDVKEIINSLNRINRKG